MGFISFQGLKSRLVKEFEGSNNWLTHYTAKRAYDIRKQNYMIELAIVIFPFRASSSLDLKRTFV